MVKQPIKGNKKSPANAFAASLFGRDASPNNPNDQPAGDGDNEDNNNNKGLAEAAFDLMVTPFTAFRRATQSNPGTENGGIFGTRSNNDISHLSLHYSSANLSEEESSSLINILDRKKYHERIIATRSADEQMQPR